VTGIDESAAAQPVVLKSIYAYDGPARGMLLQRAAPRAEPVTRYHSVAPTEWSFHPAGA